MKIAYFINQYPAVSHSFIRREIAALEDRGVEVLRIALRADEPSLADPADKQEVGKTRYILRISKVALLCVMARMLASSPIRFFGVLIRAIRIGITSERGALRHLAYFAEAMVLNQWMSKADVKHVHAHFGTNSTTVAMLASMLGGVQYSFTVHGPEEFDKPAAIHLSEKIKRAKFVVAITSFCRSQLFRQVNTDQWSKIHIVHCGLDKLFLQQVAVKSQSAENIACPEENVFVCVGRLCEQKGQLLLIEAVRDVCQTGHEMKLILAGDGPMRPEIEQKISKYGLQDVVEITGWIGGEDVKRYLSCSKAMVLPSFAEGLPVVIMEALAMGRPVITTYIAGIPELVEDGKEGWMIPAGSRTHLADALRKAIDASPETCRQMGLSGQQKVAIRHDAEQESQRLAQHFAGALA